MSERDMIFDQNILESLGIKRAHINISYKYDLESIKSSNRSILYEFDENAKLKRKIVIRPFRKRRDSTIIIFFRNDVGEIETQVRHDPKYTYVDLMEYSDGKMIKHQNYQMKRNLNWNENIYPEKLMWSDSLAYQDNGIEVYNQFGTKYKRSKLIWNEKGNIIEVKSYDRGGKWQKTIHYKHKENLLISIEEENGNKLMYDWKKEFKYNDFGLSEEKYYKNGILEYIRKISYSKNGLPELDLIRNEVTGKMSISEIMFFNTGN